MNDESNNKSFEYLDLRPLNNNRQLPPTANKQPPRKRVKKVLRHSVKGINKLALQRLARRGGVKRMSTLCYDETREALKMFLGKVIEKTIIYTTQCKRKTVTAMDVVHGLRSLNITIYGFGG
jgi:histone H4